MNLRKFFKPNPSLLSVSKTEKQILECFLCNKTEFENWILLHPQTKITFRFYYPSAIDFYFDGSRLFTAYFRKDDRSEAELLELKMSKENYSSIRTNNWKPFEEVILSFLQTQDEKNKFIYLQKTKPLQDYASICKGSGATGGTENQLMLFGDKTLHSPQA